MAAIDDEVRDAIVRWGAMFLTLDEAVEQVRSAIAAALDGLDRGPGASRDAYSVGWKDGYKQGLVELRRALLGEVPTEAKENDDGT